MSSQSSQTKNRILQAAKHLLEIGQGAGVRMSDIAKRAKISRQALYLHFASRTDLLIATTLYVDELRGAQDMLAPSRAATSGVDRLDAYIVAWCNYIPEIYCVAGPLMAMQDTDKEANAAWWQRMQDMREGCEAAILALQRDGQLNPAFLPEQAIDLLWTLLSVRNWRQLTKTCDWSQAVYVQQMQQTAKKLFIQNQLQV